MSDHEPIRTLFARQHATVFPGQGVFLAGPTPPDGSMENTWRRVVMRRLLADPRLTPSMIVVAPEPESGRWDDILVDAGRPALTDVVNKQIPWEWQYLSLCDITVFWLPMYWSEEQSGHFDANIGPTTRWEYGYYFQEYLKNPARRTLIVGAPEDASSVKWARRLAQCHHLQWHTLPAGEKSKLVPDSLIDAITTALLKNKVE